MAQIKEVREHPNADRLYVLQVDTGKDVSKSSLEYARRIPRNSLLIVGRIILVANMEPAVIRGEASNGMLLAASDANSMSLLLARQGNGLAAL